MLLDKFVRGASIGRLVQLTEKIGATVTVLDTSVFLTIVVIVKHRDDVVGGDGGTYTFAASSVKKESPTSDGYIFWDVPPTTTVDLALGIYEMEITTTETDSDYDGNVHTRVFLGESFELVEEI